MLKYQSSTCDRHENVKGESFYLYRRNLIEQFGKNLRIFTLQLTNFVKLLANNFSKLREVISFSLIRNASKTKLLHLVV